MNTANNARAGQVSKWNAYGVGARNAGLFPCRLSEHSTPSSPVNGEPARGPLCGYAAPAQNRPCYAAQTIDGFRASLKLAKTSAGGMASRTTRTDNH